MFSCVVSASIGSVLSQLFQGSSSHILAFLYLRGLWDESHCHAIPLRSECILLRAVRGLVLLCSGGGSVGIGSMVPGGSVWAST